LFIVFSSEGNTKESKLIFGLINMVPLHQWVYKFNINLYPCYSLIRPHSMVIIVLKLLSKWQLCNRLFHEWERNNWVEVTCTKNNLDLVLNKISKLNTVRNSLMLFCSTCRIYTMNYTSINLKFFLSKKYKKPRRIFRIWWLS
jgi:hypothetical protein